MLLSVFTPTHDPRWLEQAYASLRSQSSDVPWEWVIVPNGAARDWRLPEAWAEDTRIRVVPFSGAESSANPPGIGALKRFACHQARGEVLVELDHDDLLAPGALGRVLRQVERGAGFVFSDTVPFRDPDWGTFFYDEAYGWETYPVRIGGRNLLATRAFWPPTARSLCEIFYAPDHVRAWTREAYFRTGGHDPELPVADDHDLICRTYLAGIPFGYTQSPDYLYRIHDGNTVKHQNAAIQEGQARVRDKYLHSLISEWCRREGLEFLDLSGREICTRVQNLAGVPEDGAGCIKAYDNALCLLPPEQVLPFFAACYRALAPAGWLCLAFASTDGPGGFAPHFRSYHNELTLRYVSEYAWAETLPSPPAARFQKVRCTTRSWSESCAAVGYLVTQVDLSAIKEKRQPGRVLI